MKTIIAFIALLLFSCGTSTNGENLNAITTQKNLTRDVLSKKYSLVKSIKEEQIIGKWKLIASFMTIKMPDGGRGNTILINYERIYDIRKNGIYHMDNKTDYELKWELTENNTTFFDWGGEIDPEDEIDDYDQWKIRIGRDTMEWIQKVDEEYLYQVLIKQ